MPDWVKMLIVTIGVVLAMAAVALFFAPGLLAPPTPLPAGNIHPSTTVTPSPRDAPPTPSALAAGTLQTVLCLGIWAIPLVIPFTRPGTWNDRAPVAFLLGFLGWFVVNTFLWFWVMDSESGALILNPFRLLPLLVTMGSLLILGFKLRWAALGMVAAIGANAIALLVTTLATGHIRNGMLANVMSMMPFYVPFYYPVLWF